MTLNFICFKPNVRFYTSNIPGTFLAPGQTIPTKVPARIPEHFLRVGLLGYSKLKANANDRGFGLDEAIN